MEQQNKIKLMELKEKINDLNEEVYILKKKKTEAQKRLFDKQAELIYNKALIKNLKEK